MAVASCQSRSFGGLIVIQLLFASWEHVVLIERKEERVRIILSVGTYRRRYDVKIKSNST